jgi:hypothetical protein
LFAYFEKVDLLESMKLDSVYFRLFTTLVAPRVASTGLGMEDLAKVVEPKHWKRGDKFLAEAVPAVVGTPFLRMISPPRFSTLTLQRSCLNIQHTSRVLNGLS